MINNFVYKQYSQLKSIKVFITTPRKINAIIPALTVFAVWSIGIAHSKMLGYSPQISLNLSHYLALASSLFTLIFVYLWSKVILKRKKLLFWPFEYLGTITIGVLPILLYWLEVFNIERSTLLIQFLRLIFLTVLTESIVGFLLFQLQNRSSELEQHQISLVTSEEKFRNSIFSHLHDKVQSRLFSAGIQLNQIKSDLDSDTAEKVEEIVAQLEKIRILDVKKTSLEIVPPILPVGLIPSFVILLKSHKPVLEANLKVVLEIPLTDAEEDHFGIGIYRIIEQALINSLIHGNATELEVVISEHKSDLFLEITNNGKILDAGHISQGHGFAVIDGWVSKFGGNWIIANKKELVCLQARFKRNFSQV